MESTSGQTDSVDSITAQTKLAPLHQRPTMPSDLQALSTPHPLPVGTPESKSESDPATHNQLIAVTEYESDMYSTYGESEQKNLALSILRRRHVKTEAR